MVVTQKAGPSGRLRTLYWRANSLSAIRPLALVLDRGVDIVGPALAPGRRGAGWHPT